jgi:hypothetical protein
MKVDNMEVIKVNDGDCFVLETKKDSMMVHGVDGKIHYRIILKDHKAKASMEINKDGGLTVKDADGNVLLDIGNSPEDVFRCPFAIDPNYPGICNIGYACDACPYNEDLDEENNLE